MKGIILASGQGTRLHPMTRYISKQLLPVFDKPMIYYPLSVIMLAGIRDILLISTSRNVPMFQALLGDGHDIGINIEYAIQDQPRGIADAFLVGEGFIGHEKVALILGDNIFHSSNFTLTMERVAALETGAIIFAYKVKNPEGFGVVEFDVDNNVISLEEKPINPKSKYVVPGLYFYDNSVVDIAKGLEVSARGELEITTVNNIYLARKQLKIELFYRGLAWFDTGTYEGLLEAAEFVSIIQKRQGVYVSCIEEVAYRKGFISGDRLAKLAKPLLHTDYGKYMMTVLEEK